METRRQEQIETHNTENMGKWKTIGRIVAYPILHPQQSLRAMGNTTSAVVAGVGAGYVGWKKLSTDKSLVRIVGDAVIGEDTCDSVSQTVSTVTQLPGKAIDTIDGLTQTVDGATTQMSGIGKFMQNMSGGNFLDGIGNLLSNIVNGRVTGMSLMGLIASAVLLFGRFGWFGKIAGAMLGMMILGNNMGASQAQAAQQTTSQQQGNAAVERTETTQARQSQTPQAPTIHR